MPTLNLLLTSLNNYPIGIKGLNGCHNDVQRFKEYFQKIAGENGWHPNVIEWQDEQVTRSNLVSAFEALAEAGPEDRCVWVHSGHGTRVSCHPAFFHMNPDQQHRALVIYNEHGGVDYLLDKELSWLLWSATRRDGPYLLAITDCCYAGSNMRKGKALGESDMDVERLVISNHTEVKPLDEYLGYENYTETGSNAWNPPRGNYLQFSASQMHQPALERGFATGVQGVFSYAFLSELGTCGRALSYLELFHRVRARVEGMTDSQRPQLDYSPGFNTRQFLLSRQLVSSGTPYFVYYDQRSRQFQLNAGSILGLGQSIGVETEVWVTIDDDDRPLKLLQVGPTTSIVAEQTGFSRTQLTPARLHERLQRSMAVGFSPNFPEPAKTVIANALGQARVQFVHLVDDPEATNHWIRQSADGRLGLFTKSDDRPRFKKRSSANPHLFWEQVDRVARWEYLSTIDNPATSLGEEDLQITVRRYENVDAPVFDQGYSVEKWQKGLDIAGAYVGQPTDGETGYRYPAFACGVRNTSNQPLHVRALLLSNDFGIFTGALPDSLVLMPQQETWLEVPFWDAIEGREVPSPILRLEIDRILRQYQTTFNQERLVLLAATEELTVSDFFQEGMEPDHDRNTRAMPDGTDTTKGVGESDEKWANAHIHRPDWTSFHLPITVKRLLDSQPLAGSWCGHQLRPPLGCGGFSSLLCLEAAKRYLPHRNGYGHFAPLSDLSPYSFSPGFNRAPEQNLLLCYGLHGIEHVSPDHPFTITLPGYRTLDFDRLFPLGWGANGELTVLPFSRREQTLELHALPPERDLPGLNTLLRPKAWNHGDPLPEERGFFLMLGYMET